MKVIDGIEGRKVLIRGNRKFRAVEFFYLQPLSMSHNPLFVVGETSFKDFEKKLNSGLLYLEKTIKILAYVCTRSDRDDLIRLFRKKGYHCEPEQGLFELDHESFWMGTGAVSIKTDLGIYHGTRNDFLISITLKKRDIKYFYSFLFGGLQKGGWKFRMTDKRGDLEIFR